ncbi:hypothetical protein FQN49_002328 [Arthroderma sp. PD_2]|nr:hypothetical protein FQN49_002328 [Arthroderma sp. PD_2]
MTTRPSPFPNRRFPKLRGSSQSQSQQQDSSSQNPTPAAQLFKENQRRAKNREAQRNHRKMVKQQLEEFDRLKHEFNNPDSAIGKKKHSHSQQSHGEGPITPAASTGTNNSPCSLQPTPRDDFIQMIDLYPVQPLTPHSEASVSPFPLPQGGSQGNNEGQTHMNSGEFPLSNLHGDMFHSDAMTLPDQNFEFDLGDFSIPDVGLDADSDANRSQSHGRSLLHHAVITDDEKIVSALLEHGADVRSLDSSGRTPLHLAALLGHEKAVRLLLQHGAAATVSLRDRAGLIPIQLAVQNRYASIVRLLAEFGADVNLQF